MSKDLRVLHVEDSADDCVLIQHELCKAGYNLTLDRVETAPEMESALANKEWDLIMADFQMPHFTGLAALDVLKQTGIDLPFIIVSGRIGEETAVAMMRNGASDYVMKDNLERLAPAVERELHEAAVRKEQRKLEETRNALLHTLGKRVQELTALHRAAILFQNPEESTAAILQHFVQLLPAAFQYPEITVAQVKFEDVEAHTLGFKGNTMDPEHILHHHRWQHWYH